MLLGIAASKSLEVRVEDEDSQDHSRPRESASLELEPMNQHSLNSPGESCADASFRASVEKLFHNQIQLERGQTALPPLALELQNIY